MYVYLLHHDDLSRAYFRKVVYACGMNQKGHILVNLRLLEDEALRNSM